MKGASGLAGWLGAVALLFAVVSFLVEIFSSGVIFAGSLETLLAQFQWAVLNLVIGLVLVGVGLFSNLDVLRDRMRSGEARRAGKYGTSAVLGTVFAIGLLAMLAFLSTRYHTRWDWTEAQQHSLTSQTEGVLGALDTEVRITALYPAIAAYPAKELLERYAFGAERLGKSDLFQFTVVDPQGQPGALAALGVDPGRLEGGLLHVAIGDESVEVADLSEEELTNAIVKLTRREQKKVYFLDGHNERVIEGENAQENDGFAFAADALRNENYQVEPLLLAAFGEVPADADVVIAAGPTRPYHEGEHAALRAYLERGGALLVMLDPRAQTDLYDGLLELGVAVGDDVIVDRVQGLFGRPTTPFAAEYSSHEITSQLSDATIFHTARSVRPAVESDDAFVWLVRTGSDSWGETDWDRLLETGEVEYDPEKDTAGPVTVAVAGTVPAAEEGGEPGRLVVMGDSDFATNQLLGEFLNRDFFVNSVNWLLGDVEAISIRPGRPTASRLTLTQEQFQQIRMLALFVIPEAIALLGVFVWWSRRRAPGR